MLSLACNHEKHEDLQLLSTALPTTTPLEKGIRLSIDCVGLSANNKFYLGYGAKPPFNFFQAYPVSKDAAVVAPENNNKKEESAAESSSLSDTLVHPPGWGIATVVESTYSEIPVGTKFRGMLPLANQVQFDNVVPSKEGNGDFSVVRPKTIAAYNAFSKVQPDSIMASDNASEMGIALATSPGTVTGFGLYHQLEFDNFCRGTGGVHASDDDAAPILVLTSASSKVSLALAFYVQQQQQNQNETSKAKGVSVWAITSDSNIEFCNKTNLYGKVFAYKDTESLINALDGKKIVLVDVAGLGEVYQSLEPHTAKAWVVGNSQNHPDETSTGKYMSKSANVKLMWAFMGLPGAGLVDRLLKPKLDLFLIMTIIPKLVKEWGADGYQKRSDQFVSDFVKAAIEKDWLTVRNCEDLPSIREGYRGICEGTIPPSEVVLVDVATALKDIAK